MVSSDVPPGGSRYESSLFKLNQTHTAAGGSPASERNHEIMPSGRLPLPKTPDQEQTGCPRTFVLTPQKEFLDYQYFSDTYSSNRKDWGEPTEYERNNEFPRPRQEKQYKNWTQKPWGCAPPLFATGAQSCVRDTQSHCPRL